VSQFDPVKVGVLFSTSGVTGAIGASQRLGTELAIAEINEAGGIDGRELVAVCHDPRSNPARYAQLAEQLVAQDGVNVIFGCYMSSSRIAVIPVVERWNRLLFYPTLYEGFEYSRNVIYTGAAPNQNSMQLADYMTTHHGPRVYLVGSDYIYPYESNRIMADLVLQRPGGARVGERYVRLGATEADFRVVIDEIRATQPDFIFSTVVGDATAAFYRAYAEAGFDPARMPIASLTTSEAEARQMGADVARGHYTAAPYFQSLDTPANQRALASLRRHHGADVTANLCWEAAYFQVHMYADALRRAGSDQIDALLPALLGSSFEAPQGTVRIDPGNHHTWLHPRIGRQRGDGEFTVVRASAAAVAPDPYLVNHILGDWTVRMTELEP